MYVENVVTAAEVVLVLAIDVTDDKIVGADGNVAQRNNERCSVGSRGFLLVATTRPNDGAMIRTIPDEWHDTMRGYGVDGTTVMLPFENDLVSHEVRQHPVGLAHFAFRTTRT